MSQYSQYLLSLSSNSMYWKLRLLVNALEKISLTDENRPGVSASTKKAIRLLLAETTIRIPVSNQSEPKQLSTYNIEDLQHELSDKKTLLLLHKWINVEIKRVADEVIEAYRWKLQRSDEEGDMELLKNLVSHSNPLELISQTIVQEMEEERILDAEIEEWTRNRDHEMESCKGEIVEMNNLTLSYKNELTSGSYASTLDRYSEFVKLESEFLNNKQRLTNMRQLEAENPKDVIDDLECCYKRLLETQDQLGDFIQDLSNKKQKYELLGPEFRALLADWNEYGKLIQQKEFVLKGMDAVANNELSFNVSLNSSILSP